MASEPQKAITGKVVKSGTAAAKSVAGIDAMAALTELVNCVTVVQQERTKQQRLRTYAELEVARINAAEGVLLDYFERSFAERRQNFNELFERLDTAIANGDGEAANAVVRGIVDIARESPLANLGDLGAIRKALENESQVWEL